ncbi:MAG: hypothetical protein WKF84_25930 [Pyrinomonadaceae bacterium]
MSVAAKTSRSTSSLICLQLLLRDYVFLNQQRSESLDGIALGVAGALFIRPVKLFII